MTASADLFARTKGEPALGLRASDLAALRLPALLVHNRGGMSDGMHTAEVTRAVAEALPESEAVVSSRMDVWHGAILRFVEQHAGPEIE